MKENRCAYCNNLFDKDECKRTAEHIFPQGLLRLYPEEDVSFTPEKVFKDNFGLTIADVCKSCNSGTLSELDSYGNKLIEQCFYTDIAFENKDNCMKFELNFNLLSRWILKISYNYQRSRRKNCQWFETILPYIMKNVNPQQYLFSIFMGLHVNTTPLPESYYGFEPLSIVEKPKLIGTAMGISVLFNLPLYFNSIDIEGTYDKLLIRLGNAVFYILFWDKQTSSQRVDYYNRYLIKNFSFALLSSDKNNYSLRRVTASTNLTMGYGHLLSSSALKQDDMVVSSTMHGKDVGQTRKELQAMKSPEAEKKSRFLVEREMFPDNKKVKKNFEKEFGHED